MKRILCFTMGAFFLSFLLAVASAQAIEAETAVNGQWSLRGSQENHVGTSEYHKYNYMYKHTWNYESGVFYQNGNDYSNTEVSGTTLTADYDKFGKQVSIRIEFIDENTANYTLEGYSDAFGDYTVNATATRIK